MKKIMAVLLLFSLSLMAEGEMKKAVFDLSTGDITKIEKNVLKATVFLNNHYQGKFEELHSVFVIHGEAYRYFLQDLKGTPYAKEAELNARHKELATRLSELGENYNVTFEVCQQGLDKRKIDVKKLYPFVKPVYSSTSALIDWQNKGYAYIPIH